MNKPHSSAEFSPVEFEVGEAIDDRFEVVNAQARYDTHALFLTPSSEVYHTHDLEQRRASTVVKVYRDNDQHDYNRNTHEMALLDLLKDEDRIITPVRTGLVEHDGFHRYLATPFYRKGTLVTHTAKDRSAYTYALGLLDNTAEGLSQLHKYGVVHHDIKPANIFVGENGAVIGDVGIAESSPLLHDHDIDTSSPEDLMKIPSVVLSLEPIKDKDEFLGTKPFASPEALKGEDKDERADIYSLGATALYLFNRQYTFAREDEDEGTRIVSVPKGVTPSFVDDSVKDVFYDCLDTPENRPTISEIRSAIAEVIDVGPAIEAQAEAARRSNRAVLVAA